MNFPQARRKRGPQRQLQGPESDDPRPGTFELDNAVAGGSGHCRIDTQYAQSAFRQCRAI